MKKFKEYTQENINNKNKIENEIDNLEYIQKEIENINKFLKTINTSYKRLSNKKYNDPTSIELGIIATKENIKSQLKTILQKL